MINGTIYLKSDNIGWDVSGIVFETNGVTADFEGGRFFYPYSNIAYIEFNK